MVDSLTDNCDFLSPGGSEQRQGSCGVRWCDGRCQAALMSAGMPWHRSWTLRFGATRLTAGGAYGIFGTAWIASTCGICWSASR
jgi:hypothetical protein